MLPSCFVPVSAALGPPGSAPLPPFLMSLTLMGLFVPSRLRVCSSYPSALIVRCTILPSSTSNVWGKMILVLVSASRKANGCGLLGSTSTSTFLMTGAGTAVGTTFGTTDCVVEGGGSTDCAVTGGGGVGGGCGLTME